MTAITIHHYSDVLCVWAYVGQVRVDELCQVHNGEVELSFHYVDVFGDVPGRLQKSWEKRGGLAGYSKHVQDVVARFDHLSVHEEVWQRNVPNSSVSCHHFLKAIVLAHGAKESAKAAWALREAFFGKALDVSSRPVQMQIAEELKLSIPDIEKHLNDGSALSRISRDLRMANEQKISVSPTLSFNEGRQLLVGNVSYRIIEANVSELLSGTREGHSWC